MLPITNYLLANKVYVHHYCRKAADALEAILTLSLVLLWDYFFRVRGRHCAPRSSPSSPPHPFSSLKFLVNLAKVEFYIFMICYF